MASYRHQTATSLNPCCRSEGTPRRIRLGNRRGSAAAGAVITGSQSPPPGLSCFSPSLTLPPVIAHQGSRLTDARFSEQQRHRRAAPSPP